MSVTPIQFLGTGSDDVALALKTYSGVFAEAFRNKPKLLTSPLPVIHRKTVSNAGSYQFLQFAETPDAEAEYNPGEDLLGQDYAVHEGTVTRDKYIIAHHWVPRDAMRTSHFDILPRLAKADARKVALTGDRRLFILAALAAREAAVTKNGLSVHSGGNRVTRTGATLATAYPLSATGAANFRADLRTLAQQMDEDNIPRENRYGWVPPHILSVLLFDNTAQLFSEDYINGENVIQKRMVRLVEGFKIVDDSVNYTSGGGSLPNQNFTTGPTKYRANFTAQAADGIPAFISLSEGEDGDAAISMGTWESVQNIVHYDPTRLSWLVGSFVLAGCGQMSPWLAGSIEVIT